MSKFFYVVSKTSVMLLGISPLLLVFALCVDDIGKFVHTWFVFCISMLITYLVSMVLMQVLD